MWATLSLDVVDSTQSYLKEALKNGALSAPAAVSARLQHAGYGSRGRSWVSLEGNLFLSLALPHEHLPSDLPRHATAIYIAWLVRESLHTLGATSVWLKWPNDLYIDRQKVGGVITEALKEGMVAGIGLNLAAHPEKAACVTPRLSIESVRAAILETLKNPPLWGWAFNRYAVEWAHTREWLLYLLNEPADAPLELLPDGALEQAGGKVYALR